VRVARVIKSSGDVRIVPHGEGTPRNAEVGAVVYRGESVATIERHPHCYVYLRFNDGTEMYLCENAFVSFSD
jgi:hypothetical protein